MKRRAAVLLVVAAAAGCSGCPRGDGADPPGSDAAPSDASETGQLDTAPDSVVEPEIGPPPDASGGYGPFVGEWTAFPGPPGCVDLLAKEPAKSIGPLVWEACPSGRTGCQRLVVDWGLGKRRLEIGYHEAVSPSSDGPLLFWLRIYNDPDRPNIGKYGIYLLHPIAKAAALPLFALGYDGTSGKDPPSCGLQLEVGAWGYGLHKVYLKDKQRFVYWRNWAGSIEQKKFLPYSNLLSVPVGDTVFAAISGAAMHIETDYPRGIAVVDLATGAVQTTKAPPRELESPRAVAGGSIARMIGPPWGLYFVSDTGSFQQILATATGRAVLRHAIDRARGDAIVWAEGTPDFKDSFLWESPLAKSLAELAPRKIATMPTGWWGALVANAGMVLFSVDGVTARLVRVSDGQGWTIKSEPGLVFKSAVWVDDNEMWFTTANAADAAEGPSGMMRLRRDALGAPDVPSGS